LPRRFPIKTAIARKISSGGQVPYQERQIEALDQAEEPQAPGDVPRKRLRLVTRDPFIREKFTKERSAARTFAKEYFERYTKDR
jgi:hypothetical protein